MGPHTTNQEPSSIQPPTNQPTAQRLFIIIFIIILELLFLLAPFINYSLMDPRSDPELSAPLNAPDPPPPVKATSRLCSLAAGATVALLLLLVLILLLSPSHDHAPRSVPEIFSSSRGVSDGVSEKSTGPSLRAEAQASSSFPWTNSMLAWQRTGFHFQPQKNWMNGLFTFSPPSSFFFFFFKLHFTLTNQA